MSTMACLADKLPAFNPEWDADMQARWLKLFERILDHASAPAATVSCELPVVVEKVVKKPKGRPRTAKVKVFRSVSDGFKRCAGCGKPKGPTAFSGGGDTCMKCQRIVESESPSLDTPLNPKRFNVDRSRAAANAYLKAHPKLQFKGGTEKAMWFRNWEAGLVEVTE